MNNFLTKLKNLKLEFFYWRKCLFEYHNFWRYIFNKYLLAPKILKTDFQFESIPAREDLSIHVLSCRRDFIILIWSLASFHLNSGFRASLYVHDDGTLKFGQKKILKKLFPSSISVGPQMTPKAKLSKFERWEKLRAIRTARQDWWTIKKLMDPYLISDKKYRLIIDSDLLWFHRAVDIFNAFNSGDYSLTTQVDHAPMNISFLTANQARCNSGMVLYRQDNFNLTKLTEFFERVDLVDKSNWWFIEQAGYAFCLNNLRFLPLERYTVKAGLDDHLITKHYTNPRRPLFYTEGLPKIKKQLSL